MRRSLRAIALLLALGVLAGCGSSTAGRPLAPHASRAGASPPTRLAIGGGPASRGCNLGSSLRAFAAEARVASDARTALLRVARAVKRAPPRGYNACLGDTIPLYGPHARGTPDLKCLKAATTLLLLNHLPFGEGASVRRLAARALTLVERREQHGQTFCTTG
jgi:hypothetical protein